MYRAFTVLEVTVWDLVPFETWFIFLIIFFKAKYSSTTNVLCVHSRETCKYEEKGLLLINHHPYTQSTLSVSLFLKWDHNNCVSFSCCLGLEGRAEWPIISIDSENKHSQHVVLLLLSALVNTQEIKLNKGQVVPCSQKKINSFH